MILTYIMNQNQIGDQLINKNLLQWIKLPQRDWFEWIIGAQETYFHLKVCGPQLQFKVQRVKIYWR